LNEVDDDEVLEEVDEIVEIAEMEEVSFETTDDQTSVEEKNGPLTTTSSESSSNESTEKKMEKLSFGILILSFLFMIVTAYQVAENPDGIFASMCRLFITMTVFLLKIIVYPFRRLFGKSYSHHPIHTPDYRQPYRGSSNFEIS